MLTVYVIGGANGSGKTTVALDLLPALGVLEYVNADAIATGLSPFNQESMNIQAGRLMLERIEALSKAGVYFAFETTLAARPFAPFLRNYKAATLLTCSTFGFQALILQFKELLRGLRVEGIQFLKQ